MSIVIKRSGDKKKGKPNAWVILFSVMFTFIFLIPAVVVSFCAWSDIFFRPADWNAGARFAYIVCCLIGSGIAFAAADHEGEW